MRGVVRGCLARSAPGLVLAAILPAATSPAATAQNRSPVSVAGASSDEVALRARADALLAQMTPEEKAGQFSQYFHIAQLPPARLIVEQRVPRGQVGSLLFVSDAATANRMQRMAVEQSGLPIGSSSAAMLATTIEIQRCTCLLS